MLTRRSSLAGVLLGAAALAVASCGSSPTAPSGAAGVRVEGTVLGPGSGSSVVSAQAEGSSPSAASGPIIVTVKEVPSLSVTVSGNGTFVLEGLPEGTFTLVFSREGVVLGEVTVSGATAGVKVKIIVQDAGTTVILIDLRMEGGSNADTSHTCLVNGGRAGDPIELEGTVGSGNSSAFMLNVQGNRASGPVQVDASAASFKCNGPKASTDCKASLKAGAQVHVRGTLGTCTMSEARVTASEVMIQKP